MCCIGFVMFLLMHIQNTCYTRMCTSSIHLVVSNRHILTSTIHHVYTHFHFPPYLHSFFSKTYIFPFLNILTLCLPQYESHLRLKQKKEERKNVLAWAHTHTLFLIILDKELCFFFKTIRCYAYFSNTFFLENVTG